ncbi:pilus assembly protein TadG-related protein [Arthrobacter sp. LAPM80]|uniref:Tad domain-containing protein n=1 Tax=Arthrobacter sp. LAPM80 TaxID=3141788 RepID=UPI00398B81C8
MVTALLMVVLLGFAAISVDVGIMYSERAQLQNGADSAALGIAYYCAKSTTSPGCTSPTIVAGKLASANANDGKASTDAVTVDMVNRTVKVNVSSMNAANQNQVQLAFANIFGMRDATIAATATASWPAPDAMTTIPWTFGECSFRAMLTATQQSQFAANQPFTVDTTNLYLRSDNTASYDGCNGDGYANGGFGWLKPNSRCQVTSTPPDPSNLLPGVPENSSNEVFGAQGCSALPDSLLNKVMLIPLFTQTTANGANAKYTISGFGAFYVTGWQFNPPNLNPAGTVPACPSENSCRGFYGYFTGYVSINDYIAMQPGTGGTGVRLIN